MRIESSVTSISWIPSEVLSALTGLPFEFGVFHYDAPPPERIADGDLEALHEADRLRFANELRAFVEVHDGRIIDHGHLGRGLMGSTRLRLGRGSRTIPGVLLPVLRNVEVTNASVRFVQTVGGRTGVLAPRPVNRPPYVQLIAPTVWTTLALTLHADGRSEYELVGASSMPRHWIYDGDGQVTHKSGVIDANGWAVSHSLQSPWGDYDAPAVVAEVETALERNLSTAIMRAGEQPKIRKLRVGDTLTEQGTPGTELFLVLDGMLSVEVDGTAVAEVGPGAILGERALLEGGRRTATLRAATACKVAVAAADQLDRDLLAEVAVGHRREDSTHARPA